MTEWRDIPDYKGIYEASDDGQIRSKEGKTTYTTRHGHRVWQSRILKQKISKDNCCRVSLYKEGKEKTWLVHRLVALTFIPTVEDKEYINHIDGNRLNNSIENLEWCNHTENNNHAFDNELIKTSKRVVLVNKITQECHHFRSMSYASEFLGRNVGYISNKLKQGSLEIDDYDVFMKVI